MPLFPLRPLRQLLVAALIAACAASLAIAQEAELSLRDLEKKGRTVQSWCRAPITAADRPTFDQFFQRYYFPAMLKTTPDALEELADMRADLFARYIWDAHPVVQAELTDKAYQFSRAVVGSSKYPAPIRYNALLILGTLDEKYASKSDPSVKPHGQANLLLCQIVKLCAEQQKLPNYMQVGALVGLERHCKHLAALENDSKRATAIVLLDVMKQEKFRAGTSRAVQNWMKLQAAQAIANMGAAGSGGVFAKAVASLVSDDKADLETRGAAAELLSSIKLEGVPGPVGAELASVVKGLACSVAASESKAAEDFVKAQSSRAMAGVDMQQSSRFRATETGWEYERRGLVALLEQLSAGLKAVAPVAGDGAAAVNSIQAAVQKTINVANEQNIDFDVVDSIRAMSSEVTRVGGCSPETDAAPEDDEALLGAAG